jgi:hypothetical protein
LRNLEIENGVKDIKISNGNIKFKILDDTIVIHDNNGNISNIIKYDKYTLPIVSPHMKYIVTPVPLDSSDNMSNIAIYDENGIQTGKIDVIHSGSIHISDENDLFVIAATSPRQGKGVTFFNKYGKILKTNDIKIVDGAFSSDGKLFVGLSYDSIIYFNDKGNIIKVRKIDKMYLNPKMAIINDRIIQFSRNIIRKENKLQQFCYYNIIDLSGNTIFNDVNIPVCYAKNLFSFGGDNHIVVIYSDASCTLYDYYANKIINYYNISKIGADVPFFVESVIVSRNMKYIVVLGVKDMFSKRVIRIIDKNSNVIWEGFVEDFKETILNGIVNMSVSDDGKYYILKTPGKIISYNIEEVTK